MMQDEAIRKGGSRWVWAPLLLVLVLAAAWSGVWVYASRVADRTITEWLEREAQLGRVYACASRHVGGYPFRFEVRCAEPTVELRGGTSPILLRARELLAVAQIYQPDLIIAEITGPMTIGDTADPGMFSLDWSLLQASVRGLPATPERASFVLERARLARRAGAGETLASADRAEFHVRRNQQSAAAAPVFDLASRLTNASLPVWPVLAERPLNAEANGVLRGVDDLVPKPAAHRLREWQAAGGKLELTRARVQQGDALGLATGEIALTAEGRLQGGFDLTLAGFDQVTRGLLGGQTQGSGQLGLLAGLAMLGSRTEVEGKRAVSIPLRLERGALLLGPLRIAQTGALF